FRARVFQRSKARPNGACGSRASVAADAQKAPTAFARSVPPMRARNQPDRWLEARRDGPTWPKQFAGVGHRANGFRLLGDKNAGLTSWCGRTWRTPFRATRSLATKPHEFNRITEKQGRKRGT